MKTFWIRTASATVYAVLFLGSIYSSRLLDLPILGQCIFAAFALFVTLGCTYEFYKLVGKQGATPSRAVGYAVSSVVLLWLMLPLDIMPGSFAKVFDSLFVVVLYCAVPVAIGLQLWGHSKQPFADAAYTLVPAFYVAFALGQMEYLHNAMNVLVMCIIMVWTNDCFAYMGGSLFGKHKMWPRHSPGKTWEGTAIGVVFAILVGVFVGPLFDSPINAHQDTGRFDWAFLGLICGVVGTLGDLAESMLKRSVGVKDSGNIMPGHGGFLDRFDSLLFILPVVTAYCQFIIY